MESNTNGTNGSENFPERPVGVQSRGSAVVWLLKMLAEKRRWSSVAAKSIIVKLERRVTSSPINKNQSKRKLDYKLHANLNLPKFVLIEHWIIWYQIKLNSLCFFLKKR